MLFRSGSALGVAIVGAALNSKYRETMAPAVKNLPSEISEKITNSVAFTSLKPPAGKEAEFAHLKKLAFESFHQGISFSLKCVSVIALIGALLILIIAPRHRSKY